MHISDEQHEKLVRLVEELRELARNERQGGDLRRQQNAIKARFYGHAEAYDDAARRLEAIIGEPEKAGDNDPKLLNDGANGGDSD
jgi:alkanesulfonate monooxygenase SsuD/methylene tetrahydromethanopterin reductase-like flavin-dependent oxidoreductase (luciferase family)